MILRYKRIENLLRAGYRKQGKITKRFLLITTISYHEISQKERDSSRLRCQRFVQKASLDLDRLQMQRYCHEPIPKPSADPSLRHCQLRFRVSDIKILLKRIAKD